MPGTHDWNDRGAQGRPKKRIDAALWDFAQRGQTGTIELWHIIMARKINGVLGGALIAPWEVDQLDDCTIDTIMAWADDLPRYRAVKKQNEADAAAWRAKHPTYRK